MFRIADNPIIRDQIKKSPADTGVSKHPDAATSTEPVALNETAKALVLEGGRYYVADVKK